ncbi:MAG: heparinase II/III family protein [Planctomycetes bacterium]|nr:heparinase II/III family protein [Planctomycetota bacterium]
MITRRHRALAALLCVASAAPPLRAAKRASAFFPPEVVARARANAREDSWASGIRAAFVAAAEPWMARSDDDLWSLAFGNTIRRSWMVWSNGHCPACGKPVPMYEWRIDAMRRPWKVACPRCGEIFPKNDFGAFYRSGLDGHGVFDPARADRSLLAAGGETVIDDGEGYVEDGKRWRFIGAYLIYGQWKQAIVGGIRNLAAAYLVTGEPAYAHKAGVLLDRVADLYPTFDFGKEGVMYEGPPSAGYVSTWHDACVEVHDLTMAYDAVFDGLAGDDALVRFLSEKAKTFGIENPKANIADIRRNIETRILRDTLANRPKIESNYPWTDVTIATIETVLEWPANREKVLGIIDGIIERATAVDGLSGEKGIAGYAAIAPRTVADLLGRYARMDPGFIAGAVERHPRLRAMYRFHLDTYCLGRYYPSCGDAGGFAMPASSRAGLSFTRNPGIGPSSYTFLRSLHEATGDDDFVRFLYAANGSSVEGLPYDLFCPDPGVFREGVAAAIARCGPEIRTGSIDEREWCLAILRAGEGEDARAVWLDYDSGGRHGHADALNLGLFAKGLDLMPDDGYPPVQYGGWGAPRAVWYTRTAAHNTVEVDGRNTSSGRGTSTLWFDGESVRAVRASAPGVIGGEAYERTVVLVDVSQEDSYIIDIFRVAGGTEHTKFLQSHFGRIETEGLRLEPVEETRFGDVMRGFRRDADPPPAWSADWTVDDHLELLPAPRDIHLRYTDVTAGAEVDVAEGWVAVGMYGGTADAWIPRILVRRRAAQAPLRSTFAGVIEPYEETSNIAEIRRLELRASDGEVLPDGYVALGLRLAGGRRDILVSVDVAGARDPLLPVIEKESGLRLEGDLCLVRLGSDGKPRRIVLCRTRSLRVGDLIVRAKGEEASVEIDLEGGAPRIVAGPADAVEFVRAGAAAAGDARWRAGFARRKITPEKLFWMAGFAARTRPAEGTLDDLWVEALALEAPDGGVAVAVAVDIVGLPRHLYESLVARIERRYGLDRSRVIFFCSHTHSGPVLTDALLDIYPLDDALGDGQRALIDEYSQWLEGAIPPVVGEALARREPATLWAGESRSTVALNRRTNRERDLAAMLERGTNPRGPSDFAVPVLAVRSPRGDLRAVVFGYAAHTSALSGYEWSADYAGVARRAIEARHPEAMAFFFQGCGSDQSAAPRGTVEMCRRLGERVAFAVEDALAQPMRPVAGRIRTAIDRIPFDFGEVPAKEDLEAAAAGKGYRARWAKRLLGELEAGRAFATGYPDYPVAVWRLGADPLWIALGGEVAVDYAFLFKAKYGRGTWVAGYSNVVMAYIPSRRVWEEGGYQAGAFDVYGLPAERWCADIEERIAGAVERLVEEVREDDGVGEGRGS